MGRLAGKYAVITGATGGIGRAASRIFCTEGATVVGVDLDAAAGTELEKELRDAGLDFAFRAVDVTDEAAVGALAEELTADRAVDVLYNNAGAILGMPLLDSSVADFDRMQDVNTKSVFLMMRAFAPHMTNPGGSIVNTSSGGGVAAIPNMALYGAAKAGVIMLSRGAAVDLAPGIRVNALVPGLVDTAMPQSFVAGLPQADADAALGAMAAMHLTGRLAQPQEVAKAALFLASDDASFVTASALVVDGGATAV